MSKAPILHALAGVLILLPVTVLGDAPRDARPQLEQVERTYRGLDTYLVEGVIHMRMSAGGQNQAYDIPVLTAAAKPGRSRSDMQHPTMGMQIVSDGKETVVYTTQTNTYMRKPASEIPSGDATGPTGSPLSRYFSITSELQSARVVGQQQVRGYGPSVLCDVIEASYPAPAALGADSTSHAITTYWIDHSRAVVMRDSTWIQIARKPRGDTLLIVQTSDYALVHVNEPVPDSLWAFRPPPGAKEVKDLRTAGQPEAPDLSGQKAAEFSLPDLQGRTRTLSSYRGKVVLLDFWATWCGPCRMVLPHVQKLHRELRAKGLVVLGIDIGEGAATVRPFLAKNGYDFSVLLDKNQVVAGRYKAAAIPTTVIIDRKGMIVAYFTGARDEDDLREALKKAGL
jgi:thiol-disulfide isomerase/thioredoxin/outer membrane lipoprotein-sorting protein